jgi:hypothetical protein
MKVYWGKIAEIVMCTGFRLVEYTMSECAQCKLTQVVCASLLQNLLKDTWQVLRIISLWELQLIRVYKPHGLACVRAMEMLLKLSDII